MTKKVDCVRLISNKHVKGLQHCHFEWKTLAISGFDLPISFKHPSYKVDDDDGDDDRPPNYIWFSNKFSCIQVDAVWVWVCVFALLMVFFTSFTPSVHSDIIIRATAVSCETAAQLCALTGLYGVLKYSLLICLLHFFLSASAPFTAVSWVRNKSPFLFMQFLTMSLFRTILFCCSLCICVSVW